MIDELGEMTPHELLELIARILEELKLRLMQEAGESK